MAHQINREQELALKALLVARFIRNHWWGEHHSDVIVEYLKYIVNPINDGLISMIMEILILAQSMHGHISERGKVIINENLRILANELWVEMEGEVSTNS